MATDVDQSAIQYQTGLGYYGDEQMFKSQLLTFDSMTLEPAVQRIHMGWKSGDFQTVEKESRRIKGAAGSIAAVRLQNVARELEDSAILKNPQDVERTYGVFLYEVRCLKANMAKYSKEAVSLNSIDLIIKEYNDRAKNTSNIVSSRLDGSSVANRLQLPGNSETCGKCALI